MSQATKQKVATIKNARGSIRLQNHRGVYQSICKHDQTTTQLVQKQCFFWSGISHRRRDKTTDMASLDRNKTQ